jgi:hypothetical protein
MFTKKRLSTSVIAATAFLFSTFCFLCVVGASAQTTETAKTDPFAAMIAKLKGGNTKIDFKALRMSSVDSKSDDAGQPDREEYKKAVDAYNAKKFKAAIAAGEKALEQGYLGIDTHMLLAVSYRESGDTAKFDFHKAVYLGLVNSILSSGDGKSAKTAYVVIDVAEEYAILRALELNRGDQALRNEDGHKYDLLTVTDPKNGEKRSVWFNIDEVWKGYEKMLK